MRGYDLAVFLVGSPSYTFASAASSVARLAESFAIAEAVALYSRFAKQDAEKVRSFAGRVLGLDLKLEEQPRDLKGSLEAARQLLRGRRAVAVPTSGSLLGAVSLSIAASVEGADVAHVLFPFGPWTGLFYPYVPRYLQPVQLLGSPPMPRRPELNADAARQYLEELKGLPRLRKRIAEICLELNLSLPQSWVNDDSVPALSLELRDKVEEGVLRTELALRTPTASLTVCRLREFKAGKEVRVESFSLPSFPPPNPKHLREFLGKLLTALAKKSCDPPEEAHQFLGFSVLDLDPGARYVVDTNMVYRGLHNYARPGGPSILLPYCVHAEVLNKVAESKGPCGALKAEILLMAYEVLEAYAGRIPSAPSWCDVSIPSVDPELVKGATLLTADKRAFELWSRLALAKYAEVRYVSQEDFRGAEESEAHYAAIQLAALARELASLSGSGAGAKNA
ncbi:MAG: hypothetical protein QW753_03800 [Thermofilum sp.]